MDGLPGGLWLDDDGEPGDGDDGLRLEALDGGCIDGWDGDEVGEGIDGDGIDGEGMDEGDGMLGEGIDVCVCVCMPLQPTSPPEINRIVARVGILMGQTPVLVERVTFNKRCRIGPL